MSTSNFEGRRHVLRIITPLELLIEALKKHTSSRESIRSLPRNCSQSSPRRRVNVEGYWMMFPWKILEVYGFRMMAHPIINHKYRISWEIEQSWWTNTFYDDTLRKRSTKHQYLIKLTFVTTETKEYRCILYARSFRYTLYNSTKLLKCYSWYFLDFVCL